MLSLYLAAAILAGMGSSQRMCEVSPFAVAVAQVSHRAFVVEAMWDDADEEIGGYAWGLSVMIGAGS